MARSDRKSKRKSTPEAEAGADATVAGVPIAVAEPEQAAPPAESPAESAAAAALDNTNVPVITTRDLSTSTGDAEWPERQWPMTAGSRGAGFQVIIRRSVLNTINRHGQTTSDVEVCGVLAGNVYRDAVGPYLRVEAAVRGEHSGNSSAQVTFTAETWNYVQGVMEKDHADLRVVGWYHTHPGFGIFLSDMDLFIHGNFFNLPWQIALVYDPVSGEEGLFIWREGKTVRVAFLVEEDVEKEIVTVPVSAELTAAALADFSRRMQGMEKRHKTLLVTQAFLVLIALGWPFVLYTIMAERPRTTRAPVVIAPPAQTENPRTQPPAATKPTTEPAVAIPSVAPTTQPVVITPLITPPTTAPTIELVFPITPTTMQTLRPDATLTPARVETAPRAEENGDVKASVIRPNPPSGKGPRVLEGSPEQPPRNP